MLDPKFSDGAESVFSDYISAAAELLGLEPEREWRDNIAANFMLIAAAAAAIDAVMPADGAESAMVFRA